MDGLILVDLQYDFLPGGSLAVAHGNEVIPVALEMSRQMQWIFATQDWHPQNHQSFASNHPGKMPFEQIDLHGLPQTLWPDHCVQGTDGAMLEASIAALPLAGVVTKGEDPTVDSYSGFFDNGRRRETRLRKLLIEREITRLVVMGLATDYCVRATVLDALELGFKVDVLVRGCRAVNIQPDDGDKALEEMQQAGARLI